MHTRALGHAFLVSSSPGTLRTLGQPQGADVQASPQAANLPGPESVAALGALKEAKRLYMTLKASHEDLSALIGKLKADEAIGQAATNLGNANAAYQDALARKA